MEAMLDRPEMLGTLFVIAEDVKDLDVDVHGHESHLTPYRIRAYASWEELAYMEDVQNGHRQVLVFSLKEVRDAKLSVETHVATISKTVVGNEESDG
jgi:hypothetical protein